MLPWALLLCILSCSAAAAERLRVGYFSLPPHVIENGSASNSPAIAYLDKVLDRAGLQADYQNFPLSRLLNLLRDNQIDAALILARNDDRARYLDYPETPFLSTQPAFAVTTGKAFASLEGLRSTRPLIIGIWQGGYRSPTLDSLDASLVPIAGDDIASRGLRMLSMGRIDAFFSPDAHSIRVEIRKTGLGERVVLIPVPDERTGLYTVFSVDAGKRYKRRYQEALSAMRREMPYEKFLLQLLSEPPPPPQN
ncbi:substrate-binding periplasmic protein [Zoogloea dura]|uniref:Transporter substrate-binding domain-containing protein n=1 Tax=Zoogloea dura TaxID=2728840 RepID=A0A848G3I0_9RHOO|nr:transporter substrate-binding domain-containing protein [Zoogloea dura]NML24241.1 transporter substrate-binding domain-containing protein [Zoogloea dura]